jgi:hypothetical protein
MMFVTAGLLMHSQYMTEYDNATISIPIIFWSIVVITSTTVLYMKFAEDRNEKRKLGAVSNMFHFYIFDTHIDDYLFTPFLIVNTSMMFPGRMKVLNLPWAHLPKFEWLEKLYQVRLQLNWRVPNE